MTITPDQAQEWLDNADLGSLEPVPEDPDYTDHDDEWELHEVGEPAFVTLPVPNTYQVVALLTAAPDLAQTIAGMTEQWRHEAWHDRGDGVGPWRSLCWPHDDGWRNTRESADFDLAQADGTFKHRLVRRLVGPVEVVE